MAGGAVAIIWVLGLVALIAAVMVQKRRGNLLSCRAQLEAIVARANQQNEWMLAGDSRGLYGQGNHVADLDTVGTDNVRLVPGWPHYGLLPTLVAIEPELPFVAAAPLESNYDMYPGELLDASTSMVEICSDCGEPFQFGANCRCIQCISAALPEKARQFVWEMLDEQVVALFATPPPMIGRRRVSYAGGAG